MIIPKPKEMISDESTRISIPNSIRTTIKNDGLVLESPVYSKILELFVVNPQSEFEIGFELSNTQEEGYELVIKDKVININASSQSGFYYALTTLEQLIEVNKCLYNLKIVDYPNFEIRELLVDSARHFIPLEDIKKIIDLMAVYKFNLLHWHLTDDQGWRIESEKFPLLNEIGSKRSTFIMDQYIDCEYSGNGYYTKNEIKDIVLYAKLHNIDVMPEINLPGHVSAILAAYPEFGCEDKKYEVAIRHGILDDVMCIGNENLFAFAKDLYEEVIELFPYKYIHIGGDEVPYTKWDICPKCNKLMNEKNIPNASKLQAYFTDELTKLLKTMGKECIAWNEAASAKIEEKFVITYWNEDANYEDVKDAVMSGNKIIDTNYKFLYLDWLNGKPGIKEIYNYNSPFTGYLKGYGCTLFTERIASFNTINRQLMPRLLCVSEVCWGTERDNLDQFVSNVELHEDLVKKYGFNINLQYLEYDPKVEKDWDYVNQICENEENAIVLNNWHALKNKYK